MVTEQAGQQGLHEQGELTEGQHADVVRPILVEQDRRSQHIARIGEVAEGGMALARHLFDRRQDDEARFRVRRQQLLGDQVVKVAALLRHAEIGDIEHPPGLLAQCVLHLRRADAGLDARIADDGDVDWRAIEVNAFIDILRAELDRLAQLLVADIGIVRQQQR